jgi:hypothetical protein
MTFFDKRHARTCSAHLQSTAHAHRHSGEGPTIVITGLDPVIFSRVAGDGRVFALP